MQDRPRITVRLFVGLALAACWAAAGGCGGAATADAGTMAWCAPGGSSGTGGTGGSDACVATSTCAGQGSLDPPMGACTTAGARCDGHTCPQPTIGYDWASICCDGNWRNIPPEARSPDGGLPTCATPLSPGDRFPCGSAGLNCVAGQSYCYERRAYYADGSTHTTEASCRPLCAAGDCSCLCGGSSCLFDPPDRFCPEDSCACAPAESSINMYLPGTVHVTCTYQDFHPPPGACTPDCRFAPGYRLCWSSGISPPDCTKVNIQTQGPDTTVCGVGGYEYFCSN